MVMALRIRFIANSLPNINPNSRAVRFSSIFILHMNVSTQERTRSRSEMNPASKTEGLGYASRYLHGDPSKVIAGLLLPLVR